MKTTNDEKRQQWRAHMAEYKYKAYTDMLNLDMVKGPGLTDHLLQTVKNPYSSRRRINVRSQLMKYLFPAKMTNMVATMFKMTFDETTCIYAYLYSTCINGAITNKYICLGPTYDSRDGEYRSRYILWSQFLEFIDVYSDIIDMVEPMIIAKMQSQLQYHVSFYYPQACDQSREFEDSINDARLPIMFHALCWLTDFFYFHNNYTENHANSAYVNNIYQREDADIYDQIVDKLTSYGYLCMISHIEEWSDKVSKDLQRDTFYPTPIRIGQKIIPIALLEAIHPDDIRFAAWREKEFTVRLCNLMLNFVAPGFPLVINWSYINGADANLFDNMSMHEKYHQSDIAKKIVEQLDIVDKSAHNTEIIGGDVSSDSEDRSYDDDWTYGAGEYTTGAADIIDSTEDYDVTDIIGTNSNDGIADIIGAADSSDRVFTNISENLKAAALAAGRDVILSDLAICLRMEHMGRTLRNLPVLVAAHATVPELMKTYSDPAVFNKHIFEFMYNAHCMNTHIHLLHGDAHLNNVTVAWLMKLFYNGKLAVENPVIAYTLDGICYTFPHYGTFASFIDFSRAILGSESAIVHDYGNLYAANYFSEQKLRILNVINKHVPNIAAQARLGELITENLPLVFKAIASVDILTITRSLTKLFETDSAFTHDDDNKERFIPVDIVSKQLLVAVADAAYELLVANITAIIDGTVTNVTDIEWPNHILIKKFFSKHVATVESLSGHTVIDFYNHGNPLKYNIHNYDDWGPLLNVDYDTEMRQKFGIESDPDLVQWKEYIATDESIDVSNLLLSNEHKAKDIYKNDAWMQL